MFHSGDDDIHSDLSVKEEENNDILEPSSGRRYTKIVQKNKRLLSLVFLQTIFDRLEEIYQIEMFDPNKRKEKSHTT